MKKIYTLIFLFMSAISLYLILHHYSLLNAENVDFSCNLSQKINCDVVNGSKYSELFGIPNAIFSFAYSLWGTGVSLLSVSPIALNEILFFPSLAGFFICIYLLFVSLLQLKALCLYCLCLYILYGLLAAFVLWNRKTQIKTTLKSLKSLKYIKTYLAYPLIVLISFLVFKNLHQPLPFDRISFLETYQSAETTNIEVGSSPVISEGTSPKITLVEFSDFECPFCGRQSREMSRILAIYGSEIKFVFKNFPLDMSCNPALKNPLHKNSCLAARASLCAHEQGHFREYHEALFKRQTQLSLNLFTELARELHLDEAQFTSCLNSETSLGSVRADIEQGMKLGIRSTPTFYVNGKKIEGLLTVEAIEALLKSSP